MIRTFVFHIVVWISLFLSLLLFIPYILLFLPSHKVIRLNYIGAISRAWSKMMIYIAGAKIIVEGMDKIPENPDFVVISNHQGTMDVPILMSIIPYPLSFIAKKQLLKIPLINFWLLALNSVIIDRKKPLESYHKIEEELENRYNPLILFPEGTRSKGETEGIQQKGGLRLIQKSGKTVIKVKIDGSYKIWESNKKINPTEVRIIIEKVNFK